MAEETTEVNLRGEGGVVWTFDLPLSAVITEQVNQGKLVPDDEDSTLALGPVIETESEVEQEPTDDEHEAEVKAQAEIEAELADE